MKLKTKTLLITFLTYVCLAASLLTVFWILLNNGFSKIEQIGLEFELTGFEDAIKNDITENIPLAYDWSKWDDTYHFIENNNQNFVDKNLNKNTFETLNINVMSFVNKEGNIIYTYVHGNNIKNITKFTKDINNEILSLKKFTKFTILNENNTGLILINNKPIVLTFTPITDSVESKPINGTLVVGKFLNLKKHQQFHKKNLKDSLDIYLYNNNNLPKDVIEAKNTLTKNKNLKYFKILDHDYITIYKTIKNIHNTPILIAKFKIPRAIFGEGRQTLHNTTIVLTIFTLLFALITHLLLNKFVLNRFKKLTTAVNELKEPSSRLEIKGNDELSILVESINEMLTEIENSNIEIEQKREKLELLRIQLLEANIQRNRFLSSVSHELRTPLNAILGFSGVLNQKIFGQLNPKQNEYIDLIHASGKHLLDLINDLLDITKIDSGSIELAKEEFSHDVFIKEVTNMITPQASEKGIKIKLKLDKDCIIYADPRRSKQILLNLLTNAIKFSNKNSSVEIKSTIKDQHIKISVTDTGIGIPEEDLENIFTEFFQSKNAKDGLYGGTGIGLSLSKRLVRLQGGKLGVKSKIKKGSTFWFTLPIKTITIHTNSSTRTNSHQENLLIS